MRMRWVAAIAVLAGCGKEPKPKLAWGVGVATFDAVALGLGRAPVVPALAALQPSLHLELPTYDRSNQMVHPDILVESDRVVMAMTPYPYSDNRKENPSLLVGRDGRGFDELSDATNPIVPPPAIDHNDDPDLRVDPRTGEYELLYLETMRPAKQTLVALRSMDLLTWARRDAIVFDLAAGAAFIVSPTAIEVGGVTHLFWVDTGQNKLMTVTSDDGRTWDQTKAVPIDVDLGGIIPWHVDVVRGDAGFGLLFSGFDDKFVHQSLFIATSPDLGHWTLVPQPLLDYTDSALGVESLYRSSGAISGDRLVVWYSMQYLDGHAFPAEPTVAPRDLEDDELTDERARELAP